MNAFARIASRFTAPALLAAGLLTGMSAQALTLSSITDNGNIVDTSFVMDGLVGLGVYFSNTAPVTLTFTLDAADVGSSVAFNAVVDGTLFEGLDIGLGGGASFSVQGSVSTLNNVTVPVVTLDGSATAAHIGLTVPEAAIYVGAPFQTGTDWQISFGNLAQGASFTLTIGQAAVVPEAQTALMVAVGLAGVAAVARRRRAA